MFSRRCRRRLLFVFVVLLYREGEGNTVTYITLQGDVCHRTHSRIRSPGLGVAIATNRLSFLSWEVMEEGKRMIVLSEDSPRLQPSASAYSLKAMTNAAGIAGCRIHYIPQEED